MSLQTNHLYEFEDFRLDFSEKTLRRGDTIVPLTPKVFETLHIFVENAGRLIEKDELMQKLWQNHFVEESNLTFNIKMLRKDLGDDAARPRFVQTVQRRGYRFIAPVRDVEAEVGEKKNYDRIAAQIGNEGSEAAVKTGFAPVETDAPATIRKPQATSLPSLKTRAAFALAALLAGAVAVGYYFFYAGKPAAGADGKKSIAVLPLKPISATKRDDIFDFGIADSLIIKLSSMTGLKVRQLSATRKYADIEQDALAAGKEQQVDYVLASNYQLARGKIKVTSQLFNVANGQIEDTYKSEQDAADVFAMQDAIAADIGNPLSARFAATASGRTAKRGTTNEDAYRLFLQGMSLLDKRDPDIARNAVAKFEEAVRLDPNYPQAWAGIAHAHRLIGGLRRSTNSFEEYQKSIDATNKALALDPNLADAHSALCDNKIQYEWDFDGAERECKRAIELDPDSALAHQIYSRLLMGRGRFDESIAEIKTAIDLEPTSLFSQRNYGSCLYFARRYPEAVLQLKRVIAMDPTYSLAYPFLLQSLEVQEKYAEAFEWFMKSPSLKKADPETVQLYNTAYQTSGWQGVRLEQAKRFEDSDVVYFHGAVMNARIGNKDKAFEYLEKSYQRRELWMHVLKVEPGLDSIRDDPRYADLVKRVGEG